jgi:general secretion pathway protein A
VRLLTNLETPTQKLLQIILIGQPELRDLLDRNDLRQLAQRITGRYHLMPLSREETLGYVRHRLKVAGAAGEIFTPRALREIHRLTFGVPRIINVTCDRALLGAYTQESPKVSAPLVRQAATEVYGRRVTARWLGWAAGAVLAACCAIAAVAGWHMWQNRATALSAGRAPLSAIHPAVPNAASGAGSVASASSAAGLSPVSISELLANNAVDTTDAAAFRRLLSLWGTAMTDDRDPCGQAQRAGLACLDQRGSWAQVRTLNRPSILTLLDERGQRHRVVLSALDDDYATLEIGDHSQRVPLDELSRDWFGDFTLIWKPKTLRTRELSLGMHGDEVRWLRRSLNALHGAASDPTRSDVYDEDLAIAVQNFQREHRLNVDGIAGLQTQVVLDTALADPSSPMLHHTTPHG